MKTKIQGIYKIVNRINNKIYIGQSVDILCRFSGHKNAAIKKNINRPLYSSIRKYGIDSFEFITLEEVDNVLLLDQRERHWIKYYKSNNKNYGYNLRVECTTNRGCKYSEETRKRFSERQKRLCQNPDYIKNLAERNKKNWNNKDYRNNIINKLKKNSENPEFKKQHSERSKKLWQDPIYRNKMIEARKHSEEKRVQTIENNKLADPAYSENIRNKRVEANLKNGHTKIHLIDRDKVKYLYLDENYRLKDVARIMNISYGLLSNFVKVNNLQKSKSLCNKVKSIITDEQLHKVCDSININV